MKKQIKTRVNLGDLVMKSMEVEKLLPENYRFFQLEEIEFEDKDIEASYILIVKANDECADFEELFLPFSESTSTMCFEEFDLTQHSYAFEFVPRVCDERFPNPVVILTFNCR